MSQFNKPAKSNQELIQQWKTRGLIVPDEARAERYLEHISYYRFSAYTIPFQQLNNPNHHFKPNTTWAKRLKALLDSYPDIQKEYMGIPQNWELDSFWDKALR